MTITVNLPKLLEKFDQEYEFLYDNYDRVAGYSEAVDAFDEFLKNPKFRELVDKFNEYRQDFIMSDREAGAFMFALESFGLL